MLLIITEIIVSKTVVKYKIKIIHRNMNVCQNVLFNMLILKKEIYVMKIVNITKKLLIKIKHRSIVFLYVMKNIHTKLIKRENTVYKIVQTHNLIIYINKIKNVLNNVMVNMLNHNMLINP